MLADAPERSVAYLQGNPLTRFRNEKALLEEVRQKAAARLAVRVRYAVARYWPLSC